MDIQPIVIPGGSGFLTAIINRGWEVLPTGAVLEPLRRRKGEGWGFRGFSP